MRGSKKDPFLIIGRVPKGQSYQWGTISVLGSRELGKTLKEFRADGWKPVPARRHPRMRRNKSGHIVVGGQILLQCSTELALAAREREQETARHGKSEHPACPPERGEWDRSRPIVRLLPESAMVSTDYSATVAKIRTEIEQAGGAVKVEIGISLSEREIDASAALNLTAREYARRKVLMLERIAGHGSAVVLKEVRPGVFDFAELKIHYPRDN